MNETPANEYDIHVHDECLTSWHTNTRSNENAFQHTWHWAHAAERESSRWDRQNEKKIAQSCFHLPRISCHPGQGHAFLKSSKLMKRGHNFHGHKWAFWMHVISTRWLKTNSPFLSAFVTYSELQFLQEMNMISKCVRWGCVQNSILGPTSTNFTRNFCRMEDLTHCHPENSSKVVCLLKYTYSLSNPQKWRNLKTIKIGS